MPSATTRVVTPPHRFYMGFPATLIAASQKGERKLMNPVPGWYDDGQSTYRWWDGSAWTHHVGSPPTPPHDLLVTDCVAPTHPGVLRTYKTAIASVSVGAFALLLVVALSAAIVVMGTPRDDEARMEASLNAWVDAVNENDFERFKELSHPQMWATNNSSARISFETARRHDYFPTGIKNVEFSSTDVDETAFHFGDLAGETTGPQDVEDLREVWQSELGLDPDDIGVVGFRPDFSSKTLKTRQNLAGSSSYALFDLRKESGRNPRLLAVYY